MCFFFNDTATTEIYTLSLHDALPIFFEFRLSARRRWRSKRQRLGRHSFAIAREASAESLGLVDFAELLSVSRSEEHTSELQSHLNLVCRLLLEKKKTTACIDRGS